jgi:large subunit ribosomal protein L22
LSQSRAEAKYVRLSARKARLVLDHIRGRTVPEARTILAFTQRAAAVDIEKVLSSAVANAESTHALDGDELVIVAAYADEGPTLKRWRARARGRVNRIRKRTCHITITLAVAEPGEIKRRPTRPAPEPEPEAEKPKSRRKPRAKKPAAAPAAEAAPVEEPEAAAEPEVAAEPEAMADAEPEAAPHQNCGFKFSSDLSHTRGFGSGAGCVPARSRINWRRRSISGERNGALTINSRTPSDCVPVK